MEKKTKPLLVCNMMVPSFSQVERGEISSNNQESIISLNYSFSNTIVTSQKVHFLSNSKPKKLNENKPKICDLSHLFIKNQTKYKYD